MYKKVLLILVTCCIVLNCKSDKKTKVIPPKDLSVIVTGQMKDVMWKGELFGKIKLDTIPKNNLYGIGPKSFLTGEILINNGKVYESKVLTDSTMLVKKNENVSAPFFVHSHVKKWIKYKLPNNIKTVLDIERYITALTKKTDKPFAFKLEGDINSAEIHIQNLPKGSKVSSPKEAHKGQINYNIKDKEVTLIGFYSKNHKGIFTHHDTNMHMHLITKDETKMGHLDEIEVNSLTLYLPKDIVQQLIK